MLPSALQFSMEMRAGITSTEVDDAAMLVPALIVADLDALPVAEPEVTAAEVRSGSHASSSAQGACTSAAVAVGQATSEVAAPQHRKVTFASSTMKYVTFDPEEIPNPWLRCRSRSPRGGL